MNGGLTGFEQYDGFIVKVYFWYLGNHGFELFLLGFNSVNGLERHEGT